MTYEETVQLVAQGLSDSIDRKVLEHYGCVAEKTEAEKFYEGITYLNFQSYIIEEER